MDRYVFAVGDDVFCCWEHDLAERNDRFLATVDGEYFHYVAHRYIDQLDGDDRQRAAVALRGAYHHGLETLFSLLGALVQAPGAVAAWIPKCSTGTLRELVAGFLAGSPVLTQLGPQRVRMRDLAGLVHQFCWPNDDPRGATGERFGRLWSRFAHDFSDPHHISEYNSIKHGFRVASGGFVLRMGREEEYGVPAPEANMETVDASPFGTSFYEVVPVLSDGSAKHHIRIGHQALNWRPEAMVQRLQLIAWSIDNVVSGLRCINGVPPGTVQFHRPEDPTAFESAWNWNVGAHASNFDFIIDPTEIDPVPRGDLRSELQARTVPGDVA